MTSPILPSASSLTSIRYTPAELIADRQLESYFTANNGANFGFIIQLLEAYRNGNIQTTYIFSNSSSAVFIANRLSSDYGYWVDGPIVGNNVPDFGNCKVSVSWASTNPFNGNV